MDQQQRQQQQNRMGGYSKTLKMENDDDDYDEFDNGEACTTTKMPLICILQKITLRPDCNPDNFTIQSTIDCILAGPLCGRASEEYRGKLDRRANYLVTGPFCEYHYSVFLNGIFANVNRNNRLIFAALNLSLVKNPTTFFPVWSLQPLNQTSEDFRDMIASRTISSSATFVGPQQDELMALAKLLAGGTIGVSATQSLTSNKDNIYTQVLNNFKLGWETKIAEEIKCWKNDSVFLYFTEDYLIKVQSNAFVQSLLAAAAATPDGGDLVKKINHPTLTVLEVPIRLFPLFDILIMKTFEFSHIHIPGQQFTGMMHNIQIINGNYVYGTGNGLTNVVPFKSDQYNKPQDYRDADLNEIIYERQLFNNVQTLVLDGVVRNTRKKAVAVKQSQTNIAPVNSNTLAVL
nr:hypothetical protein [Microctonus hyperodae filamentous virus]